MLAKRVVATGVCAILLASWPSTAVVDCVVATQLTTTFVGADALAGRSGQLRIGEQAQRLERAGIGIRSSGSVDLPLTHSAMGALGEKWVVSGVASLPLASVTPEVTTAT